MNVSEKILGGSTKRLASMMSVMSVVNDMDSSLLIHVRLQQ